MSLAAIDGSRTDADPTTDRSSAAVAICVYTEDRWDDIVTAMASVDQQTHAAVERIVVVDHNPALLERLRRVGTAWNIIASTGERGLSGARNTAASAATATWIAFLDDDARAEPEWLDRLVTAMLTQGASGGGGHVEPRWELRPRWLPEEFWWVVGCSYRGLPTDISPVRNPIGASMIVRRRLLLEVGGFSSTLGRIGKNQAGCEETEMCIRATAATGSMFLYVPSAIVHHRVPTGRSTASYFSRRCYSEGVSKRQVTQLVGSNAGLAAERSFAMRATTSGVVRHCSAIRRGDTSGLARAMFIIAGMAITTTGYVSADVRRVSARLTGAFGRRGASTAGAR